MAQINIEEDEHTFEPIDPMDDNFVGFRKQLDHKNFGSLSSIPKFIGGGRKEKKTAGDLRKRFGMAFATTVTLNVNKLIKER